jgi:hypothetical protein
MSPVAALSTETFSDTSNSQTRSTSTTSRASSSRSSSSRESQQSPDRARQISVPLSPKPSHKKSSSFSRLFGAKEPSLDSFKQLAEQQQKELAQKGQKIPFGVPQAKLPSSVKDDYKKAKQRAKERAKLHEAVKEKFKLHDDEEKHGSNQKSSVGSTEDEYHRASTSSITHPPRNPKAGSKRFSSLDPLPELPNMDAVVDSPRTRLPHSPPTSYEHKRTPSQVTGVLTGNARKEALPWE